MFTFSQKHDWQGNPAVSQILVFTSHEMQKHFETVFTRRVAEQGIEHASDNSIGVAYKLRAVLDHTGRYVPVIRCGFAGYLIWEGHKRHKDTDTALLDCLEELREKLYQSLISPELQKLVPNAHTPLWDLPYIPEGDTNKPVVSITHDSSYKTIQNAAPIVTELGIYDHASSPKVNPDAAFDTNVIMQPDEPDEDDAQRSL